MLRIFKFQQTPSLVDILSLDKNLLAELIYYNLKMLSTRLRDWLSKIPRKIVLIVGVLMQIVNVNWVQTGYPSKLVQIVWRVLESNGTNIVSRNAMFRLDCLVATLAALAKIFISFEYANSRSRPRAKESTLFN